MKYSIIIPIYNAENYITVIVNNLLRLSYKDFEVILVNDGSKDNSLIVCKHLSKIDHRVVVVDQTNGGPSKARNAGLDVAQGEYILFADADDDIHGDFLAVIDKYVTAKEADVYCYGYLTVRSDFRGEIDMIPEEKLYATRQDILASIDEIADSFWFNVVYDKVYKRSYLRENNIRFDESLYLGEDRKFCLEVLKNCSSWYFIPESLYVYKIQNTNSISAKVDLNNYLQGKEVQRLYASLLEQSTLSQDTIIVKSNYELIRVCIAHFMQMFRSDMKNKWGYAKKIYMDNPVRDKNISMTSLQSRVKRITYWVWTKGGFLLVYLYSWMLYIYKFKAKLYKEG